MGLFGELVASVARFNYGWKPVGASGYDAFNIALDAFRMFGTDRQKAIKYLTDGETRHYDYLREKYPSGYDEYKKKMEEMRERERLLAKARYEADPFGAWAKDLKSEEDSRMFMAEWDRMVDRDRGIYRPDSYYGL